MSAVSLWSPFWLVTLIRSCSEIRPFLASSKMAKLFWRMSSRLKRQRKLSHCTAHGKAAAQSNPFCFKSSYSSRNETDIQDCGQACKHTGTYLAFHHNTCCHYRDYHKTVYHEHSMWCHTHCHTTSQAPPFCSTPSTSCITRLVLITMFCAGNEHLLSTNHHRQ